MVGEQQIIKARDKSGADPFATENVAHMNMRLLMPRLLDMLQHLNELKNLINLR